MKVFARGRAEFETIIVPFNSPLKPILQKTVNDLIEAGIQDAIFKEWEGTGVSQVNFIIWRKYIVNNIMWL